MIDRAAQVHDEERNAQTTFWVEVIHLLERRWSGPVKADSSDAAIHQTAAAFVGDFDKITALPMGSW